MPQRASLLILTMTLASSTAALAQNAPPPRNNNGNGNGQVNTTAATDPGLRTGPADAGSPLADLETKQWNFFAAAQDVFNEITSVFGNLNGEEGRGLGPRFNHTSCGGCHAFPSTGGTSPPRNPQIAAATAHGAQNAVPSFITANGPVRVARLVRDAQGRPDGGVHALFTITGRTDAGTCRITQPNFAAEVAADNVVFRIPTPLYGLGLVENTPDANLRAAFNANAALKESLGISGHFNFSGNDGSIMRFGWKAQNKSLMMFSGEAYNVEQGVTNEVFPNEREDEAACQLNATPEDGVPFETTPNAMSPAAAASSDTANVTMFARLLAAPAPVPNAAAVRGEQVFSRVGCHTCHTPTQTTGRSEIAALDRVSYHPYSDFALHNMGGRLNDRITQGGANGGDWRTAPLWGLGQRVFFLHDGRTSDLVTAIQAHASQGSEANTVIGNFNTLSRQDMADLLAFLRAL
ncbi:MAG: thiol oxidoreductase [Proteobacteria bacterium]|nr:thiol oxidoreductase [Pseudomonadota bacterium]